MWEEREGEGRGERGREGDREGKGGEREEKKDLCQHG